jgi:hypothetical protein
MVNGNYVIMTYWEMYLLFLLFLALYWACVEINESVLWPSYIPKSASYNPNPYGRLRQKPEALSTREATGNSLPS